MVTINSIEKELGRTIDTFDTIIFAVKRKHDKLPFTYRYTYDYTYMFANQHSYWTQLPDFNRTNDKILKSKEQLNSRIKYLLNSCTFEGVHIDGNLKNELVVKFINFKTADEDS